jgi:serine/threonine protein kinase
VLVHDGRMMIGDLGFSDTWHDSTKPYHDEMIPFLEPLFLQNNSYQRDKRSDIYSLGVIMCEVSSGRPPFESTASNFHLLLRIIMNGERETTIVPGAPLQYVQLYRHCWDGDPISRPTIQEVLHRLNKMQLNSSFVKPGEVRFNLEPTPPRSSYVSNNDKRTIIKRHSHPNISPSSSPTISPRMAPPIILDPIGEYNIFFFFFGCLKKRLINL